MEFTDEMVDLLYDRAMLYAEAKWGSQPDKIRIESSGELIAVWEEYCCGGWDTNQESFYATDLNSDLDVIIAKRKEEEALRIAKHKQE